MKKRSDKPWETLHLCGGMGGGGLGAKRAGAPGKSVDLNAGACRNYERLTGMPALCADITKLKPHELRDFHGGDAPDVAVLSAPCKGLSRCMSKEKARTEKYQNLNWVGLACLMLALEAWPERPPPIFLLEQVPGILTEDNLPYLERVEDTLRAYGYSVDRRVHDCGETGGLGQRRRRMLLIARHMEQVPNFIRMPPKQRVKGIGEVIGGLPVPLPGSGLGGPMHSLPRQSRKNWARLASIRQGKDWRDLPAALRLKPRAARQNGGFGVQDWSQPSHTIVANAAVRSAWASVADPRLNCKPRSGAYGVAEWDKPSRTVLAHHDKDNTMGSVADPRGFEPTHFMTENARDDGRIVEIEGPAFDWDDESKCHMIIQAPDGTVHRPLTTLELAVLQGFPARDEVTGEWLVLDGRSHAQWREHIGDAIPVDSAEAMIRACVEALTEARDGFRLVGDGQIWVAPEARAA